MRSTLRLPDRLPDLARATSGAGDVVAGAVSLLARARRVDMPMHPRGEVQVARLRRTGGGATGAAFLDDAGEDEVLVRFSRSIGLPAPLPDVNGLALRVPVPGAPHEHADVLLVTTGRGTWSRYALLPTVRGRGGFLGTLLPYQSPSGALHLGARPLDESTWELAYSHLGSSWTPFARLELSGKPGRDLDLSFDATTGAPPGLTVPDWHRRLRAPSYAAARRVRRRHR